MNLIDLFSGCGGFALGAHKAGFTVPLAFDVDSTLTSSYKYNFPDSKINLSDIGKISGADITALTAGDVDGVFGGPPCQGFSSIGLREVDDPRRKLLNDFFRIVADISPKFFIMENVVGLGYSDTRYLLDNALDILKGRYSILGPIILDASEFGAPTKRRRLFVLGWDSRFCDAVTMGDIDRRKRPATDVKSAIADLSEARYVDHIDGFDTWKITRSGRPSDYAASLRTSDGFFTGNQKTKHSAKIVKRFSKILQGGVDSVGRHVRLRWDGQCPTLRAGTGSDRGSYQSVRPIHPEEPRVITVREAARLQGFPDNFRFHPSIWHSFRMIGNSVSPVQSRVLFDIFSEKLHGTM